MTPAAVREPPLLLMTPGPTRLPQRVLDAGGQPMIHHRTAAFSRTLVSVIERLRPIYGTAAGDGSAVFAASGILSSASAGGDPALTTSAPAVS